MIKKNIKKILSAIPIAFVFLTTNVWTHEYKIGDLKIIHPYILKTYSGARIAGGYMKIVNTGSRSDFLTAVKIDFAKTTQIHQIKMRYDVMLMQEINGGLEILPNSSVELKQWGYHIMFINIINSMVEGETHDGTLYFEKAGAIKVIFNVEKMGFKLKHDN